MNALIRKGMNILTTDLHIPVYVLSVEQHDCWISEFASAAMDTLATQSQVPKASSSYSFLALRSNHDPATLKKRGRKWFKGTPPVTMSTPKLPSLASLLVARPATSPRAPPPPPRQKLMFLPQVTACKQGPQVHLWTMSLQGAGWRCRSPHSTQHWHRW